MSVTVLKNLITDIILGRDFMTQHQSINIHFRGIKPTLQLNALEAIKTSTPVKLFQYLHNDCRFIATKERCYSWQDKSFIFSEIKRLLADGLIESSNSPWRSQQLVVTQDNHKKQMVINYNQTINKFTFVDSYSLPKMHDVVQKVAQYKIYLTLDMSSAYHQVEIPACDRMYIAFQAKESLWQWKRIPFGLMNGVPCFQRIIDKIIISNKCMGMYTYLDNITVGGKTQEEQDANLEKFLKVAKDCNLTLNKDKCVYSAECNNLLGYQINSGSLKPNLEQVETLLKLSLPRNSKELQ